MGSSPMSVFGLKRSGFARRVVIMVKTPKAGRVKTRLGRDIGVCVATQFYRHMVKNVIRRVAADTRWETWLAVSPDQDVIHPFWFSELPRIGQGKGCLGQRMQSVMDELPPGPVVIIGTDIPEIQPFHIMTAFQKLGKYDAVFGPADDGGYWLVGQKRFPKILSMFGNVRWSSPYTLEDTLVNLSAHKVTQIMELGDIDTVEEYLTLKTYASRHIAPIR